MKQAEAKLEEMVATELTYLEDLQSIVEGYWGYMVQSKIAQEDDEILSMPDDLKEGKDEIAVGWPNINRLYSFHKT